LGVPLFIAVAAWLLVFGFFARPMDHDEVEHLHASWLVAQGQVPFRDFWQHHSPMLYLVLSPLMRLGLEPTYIPFVAKAVSLLLMILVAAACWVMAREVWGSRASLGTYTLIWIAALPMIELFTIRPDVVATLLVLGGLVPMMLPGRHVNLRYFAAGCLLGLGLSFSPKLYLVLLAPVLAGFWRDRVRALPRLVALGLGVAMGAVPLLAYLVSHHIVPEFREWVIQFNVRQQVPAGYEFHPVLLALGLLGAWQLVNRPGKSLDEKTALFLLAYLFTGISAIQNPLPHTFYYAAPWMILTAVSASGISVSEWLDKAAPRAGVRLAVAGLGLALLLYPTLITFARNRSETQLASARWSTWAKLSRLSAGETCIGLAPFHPIFSQDAIGLYSDWQSTFAYLDPAVRKVLTDHQVLASITRDRPATISGCTVNENQAISDYLLDISVISPAERDALNRYLAENYTIVHLGRPFYVRNDLLGRARELGIDVPQPVTTTALRSISR
jgi:hypothetical protein